MIVVKEFSNKHFIWDGNEYSSEEEAEKAKSGYENEGFEIHLSKEDGKFLIFTRRVVTDVKVEEGPV